MERGPWTVWASCLGACFLIALLSAQCGAFSEEFPSDQKVLVLLDDLSRRSSLSVYFQSLTDRGYELDFKLAEDPKLALQRYGKYLYDALILFAPSVERFGGSLDAAGVLDFVDSGHDLVLAADVSTSDVIRDIATECGVDFDEDAESVVIDHISFAETAHGDRSLIVGDKLIDSPVILGKDGIKEPILFRGIGHSVNTSELVVKVLSASPSAFSGKLFVPLREPPVLSGTSIGLVSVVQARNNARILISGSLDLFSDKFFKSEVRQATDSKRYPKSGNEKFATELTKWVFHERGHLKAVNLRHKKVDEEGEPSMYRITDNLEFSVDIYEWTGKHWHPYQADDVQVQFYMMSPYIRKTLSHDGKGHYHTKFQVPDVYGVFQFKVEYWRLGYTSLTLSKQIPVRPFRHNEYERFIPAAFPYYGASFSMMVAFFIFGLVFLYQK